MARVLIRTQAWGPVVDRHGEALPSLTYALKNTDGTAATHWSAQTGGSSSTATLTTDSFGVGTLSGADRWVEQGEYDLVTNGNTYRVEALNASSVISVSRFFSPSGGDDSAAIATAVAAGGTIVLGPGTFLWNTTVPAFTPNLATTVRGSGVGKTIIKLSSSAKRAFDCPYVADYDLYRDIELSDFSVDASSLSTPASNQHLVFGNLINGGVSQRVNFSNISCRRITVLSGPTTSTGSVGVYEAFFLGCKHVSDNEATQTSITNVVWEDLTVNGCNFGFAIIASSPGNSANCLIDQIKWNRLYHDGGIVPTNVAANGGNQIGSAGFGGEWTLTDCYFRNALDVGIELDAPMLAKITRVTCVDCKNEHFLLWAFHAVPDVTRQRYVFDDCHVVVESMVFSSTTPAGQGWQIGAASSNPLGSVSLTNCTVRSKSARIMKVAIQNQGDLQRLALDNVEIIQDQLADATTTAASTFVQLLPISTRCAIIIHNLRVVVVGSITSAGMGIVAVGTGGATASTDVVYDVDGVELDCRLSGLTFFYGVALGASGANASATAHGAIRNVVMQAGWTGVAPNSVVNTAGSVVQTLSPRLTVATCDGVAGGGGSIVSNSGQAAGLVTRDNAGFNPVGVVTVAVPSTGNSVTAQPYDRTFYITNGTSALTCAIQSGPSIVIPASALGTVRLPAGKTMSYTYAGGTPTQVVEGE